MVIEDQKVKMFNSEIQMMNPGMLDRCEGFVSRYCLRLYSICAGII